MQLKTTLLILILPIFSFISCLDSKQKNNPAQDPMQHAENSWKLSEPVFLPGSEGTFDEVAVKDPSLVFFEGYWHLFYTARDSQEYTTGYASAKRLEDLTHAKRHELTMIRGNTRYGCAPQIFYFEPQATWYLLFQTRDTNYQPAFSTTQTISDPGSWTKPQILLKKDEPKKWIDFWIISDEKKVYLFYTQAHKNIIVRSTRIQDFPMGWSKGSQVFSEVHEAVHIYKVKGKEEYHMIYELNTEGIRSFGLATATQLEGPWKKQTDSYARGDQLVYAGAGEPWSDMVSHGEVIRAGYDQRMEYNPTNCQWLIQGMLKKDSGLPYPLLSWKLGLMTLGDVGAFTLQ